MSNESPTGADNTVIWIILGLVGSVGVIILLFLLYLLLGFIYSYIQYTLSHW